MSLLRFPNELLADIARYFVPPLSDLDVDTRAWSNPKTGYATPNGAWVEGRRVLQNLARTCRTMNKIAIASLYHSIFIWDGGSASILLHTLMTNPALRQHVRVLAVVEDMTGDTFEGTCWDTFTGFDWDLKAMTPFERRIFGLGLCEAVAEEDRGVWHGLQYTYRGSSIMGQSAIGSIICLVPNLHTLHLVTPSSRFDEGFGDLREILRLAYSATGDAAAEESFRWDDDDEARLAKKVNLRGTTLQMLSTLRLVGDTSSDDPGLDTQLVFLLSRFSETGIRTMALFGHQKWFPDSGLSSPTDPIRPPASLESPASWESMTEFRHERNCTDGAAWYELCSRFPKLKTLNISIQSRAKFPTREIGQACFDGALRKLRKTLECLVIDSRGNTDCRHELSTNKVLSSLTIAEQLTYLDIELFFLFEEPSFMGVKSPSEVFPSSLKSLVLYERWPKSQCEELKSSTEKQHEYGRALSMLLGALVLNGDDNLPFLKSVEFYQKWDYWKALFITQRRKLGCNSEIDFTLYDRSGHTLEVG